MHEFIADDREIKNNNNNNFNSNFNNIDREFEDKLISSKGAKPVKSYRQHNINIDNEKIEPNSKILLN
jgi:hypothetical protein